MTNIGPLESQGANFIIGCLLKITEPGVRYVDRPIVVNKTLSWLIAVILNKWKIVQRFFSLVFILAVYKQKQTYRGMFENQKSGNKTSSGDIGLNIRTLASPKVGQDQLSRGVSVLCWHAAPVANVLWKPLAIR